MSNKPQLKALTVAIDGPAGAGKSTVAKRLAACLGYVLLDTGALYRCVALAAKRASIDWNDEAAVASLAQQLAHDGAILLQPDADAERGFRVLLGGDDVSQAIRTSDVSMGASRVSAIAAVRQALLDLQRSVGRAGAVVAEGRDIGTVVFPEAEAKFFLTASVDLRARRRQAELEQDGSAVDISVVRAEVVQRDQQDSQREHAPLRQADDAVLVDSTDRSVEDVVAEMQRVVQQRAQP